MGFGSSFAVRRNALTKPNAACLFYPHVGTNTFYFKLKVPLDLVSKMHFTPNNTNETFICQRRVVALMAIVLFTLLGTRATEEQQTHNGRRTASATNLLNRLYEAAKERADNIRKAEGTSGLPRNKDMLSSLLDYTSDKLQNPPLRSTEQNFVLVQRDIAVLRDELKRLREVVRETRTRCGTGEQQTIESETKSVLDEVPTQLVPIQSKSKSILT